VLTASVIAESLLAICLAVCRPCEEPGPFEQARPGSLRREKIGPAPNATFAWANWPFAGSNDVSGQCACCVRISMGWLRAAALSSCCCIS
jgi:hypothetical protein